MGVRIYKSGYDPKSPSYKFYVGTPKETTLVFSEPEWRYYKVMPDGGREPQDGVTTVLHATIDRSGPLMAWAVKRAMIRLKNVLIERGFVVPTGSDLTADPLYEEVLDTVIKQAKAAAKDELEDAGNVGTASHDWLERLLKSILAGDDDRRDEILAHFPLDERASNCVVSAIEFIDRHAIVPVHSERKCFSFEHGVAGTLDVVCRASSCDDVDCCPEPFEKSLVLLDFKTANGLYVSHLFQTAIYQQAYQEETGEHIERRFVLKLPKDEGTFESWHAAGDELFQQDLDGFLNALALYRSLHTIETRISDNKEAKRQRQKESLVAERAVRCLDADRYKGVRKKKGCNGSDIMCETCTNKYWEHNGGNGTLGSEGPRGG